MGKEKTNSNSIGHNSNDANKTIEENKENSLKNKNSVHSHKSSRKSSKLNSTKSEVLEDELTSDSSSSADTKASSSRSSNITINSSSTSTTKSKNTTNNVDKKSKSAKKNKEEESEDEETNKKSAKKNKGVDEEILITSSKSGEESEEEEINNKKSPEKNKESVDEEVLITSSKSGEESEEEEINNKKSKKSTEKNKESEDEKVLITSSKSEKDSEDEEINNKKSKKSAKKNKESEDEKVLITSPKSGEESEEEEINNKKSKKSAEKNKESEDEEVLITSSKSEGDSEDEEINKKSKKSAKKNKESGDEKVLITSPKSDKQDKEDDTKSSKSAKEDKKDEDEPKSAAEDKEENKEKEKEKDTEKKEDKDENKQNSDKKEEPQFRIAPNTNNSTGFKLRIVPLEKLLEKPPKKPEPVEEESLLKVKREVEDKSSRSRSKRERDNSFESSSTNRPQIRRLPERSRKPVSFVELSSESESEDEIESVKSSTSSEDAVPIKTAAKRQAATSKDKKSKDKVRKKSLDDVESIKSSTSSEDGLPLRTAAKRQASTAKDKKSKDTEKNKSSESSDDVLPIKTVAKRQANKKANSSKPRPPSPSSVRRCVVKLKRSNLSDFKNLKSTSSNKNKKNKMNGNAEKPSTSSGRRKRVSSDEDSDFDVKQAGGDSDDDRVSVAEEPSDSQADSSDSEIMPTRKRRVFQKGKGSSNNSDDDFEPEAKPKKKKRRIQKNSSGDDSDDDDEEEKKDKTKRKDIRKIIKTSDLNISTKTATKEEEERRKRIEERQKLYNEIYEKPDSVEVSELVLDFDPKTKKTLLEVDKGLMKKLKPHQVTGVKFMWDACFETLEDAQEKPGSGCILAHCMGLGKTMQICTLSHTLLSNSAKTGVERVLIISPLSTLNNWAREFKQWIGFTRKRNIEIYDLSKYKDKNTRIFKLNEWYEEGGVCIMGYDMYRILTNEKAKGLRKKQREHLHQSLVDPGPDMVVCDEGHLLKNEKTSISKAVTRMRTLRRIVLTGTPLQNNLKEYYCMIQFIKPNLLGTYKEYLNRFVNPITNGQYADSTDRDMRLMKHRSHILHQLLQGCIQRRDYSVLAPYLPPKHEYVVYTTLSIVQQLIYEHYMTHQRDVGNSMSEGKGARLFQDFQELRRIWTHPMNMRINSDSVIRKKVLANETDSMEDFIDDDNDDEDDAVSSDSSADSSKSFGSGAAPKKVAKTRNFRRDAAEKGIDLDSDIEETKPVDQDDPSEWWKRFVSDKELNNINHSPKLVILMRLLEECEKLGDKLLVFSQSLQSLDTIEHFLSLIDSKTRGYEYEGDVGDFKGFWNPGTDYFRLDGSCSVEQRETMCRKFNDATNLRARLFLISTRAGGLGINLVSANRVVIFDVSWNPSHDTQSIFRVYRFGQIKPCYIYRLIAMGTMEQKLYERQVAKQATAKRVIDEQQISRHYNQSDLQELYTYELKPSVPREIPILPKDRLFAELLQEHEDLLFKYHEHDSLLENEESENLSESERKEAWSEFEAEKTRAVQTNQFMSYDRGAFGGNQFGNAAGSVTSNKIFGFRSDVLLQLLNMKIAKDHPEMNQNQVIQVVPTYLNELYSQMNNGDPTMYKDLLTLHATLVHPSGMYMSPLLYANQNPGAAGYYQANPNQMNNGMMHNPMAPVPIVPNPAPGFDPNEVYEID